MSPETKHFYEFGDFRLDPAEKVLSCRGRHIPITPKVFETLLLFVENAGHLLEKDELMRKIWQDSFVEESNLTFNIKMLRRALDDKAKTPRVIETVPRRGYRFIAEVRTITAEPEAVVLHPRISSLPAKKEFTVRKLRNFNIPMVAVAFLLVGTIAYGIWVGQGGQVAIDASILSEPFSSEKLSTDGNVWLAIVSPDGKTVVYMTTNGGKQSLWLRQLESSNNIQIIPPSDDFYFGLALSPDGNFLYFTRRLKSVEGQADIYRVSIFGGVPIKIITETQGWISISPEGEKISFVRCYYRDDEYCSLWIADAYDGKNEKKLASRPSPFRIGDNEIAPDGRTVTFAAGQSRTGANEFGLFEADIETGEEREFTAQKFFNIRNLEWLPHQSDLLITASRVPNRVSHIWKISPNSGEALPLTKDSEEYSALSLSKDAKVLISTQTKAAFRLRLFQTDDPTSTPRILANAETVAFAPNSRIIFSSLMTGNSEIWSVNADGSEQRQLTNDAASDVCAVVSPNNNFIYFASDRSGGIHVWRMNPDGSDQTQITQKEGGFPIFTSPDGKWVFYISALQKNIWRVSTSGGKEERVLNKTGPFAFSPDGLLAAFAERQDEGTILSIISLDNKQTIKTFKIPDRKVRLNQLAWSPDGKTLAYILSDGGFENNTLWFQTLGQKIPRKIADLGNEEISGQAGFALSPDGKSFAVVQGNWKRDAVLLKGLR